MKYVNSLIENLESISGKMYGGEELHCLDSLGTIKSGRCGFAHHDSLLTGATIWQVSLSGLTHLVSNIYELD